MIHLHDQASNLSEQKIHKENGQMGGRIYYFEAEYLKANKFLEKGLLFAQELGIKDELADALCFFLGAQSSYLCFDKNQITFYFS